MFTYRVATIDDIENIVRLVESAYRGDSSRHGWTTEADFIDGQRTDREEVLSLLEKPNHAFLLCEEGDQLVATTQLNKTPDKAYLGMFAVDPLKQGGGIGLSLLKQAEKYVQDRWGSRSLQMSVISIRTELIDWYMRHGYKKTGVVSFFPYGEPRYGIPNRDDLVLEMLEKKLVKTVVCS